MKVIINSDDFGLTYSFNEGVKETFINGITTSASIRVNGTAYRNAISLVNGPLKDIGLGIHLNLTDGKTTFTELSNKTGDYEFNFIKLLNPEFIKKNSKIKNTIIKDLINQFNQIKRDGINIDHIDSEKHIHMIPWIFEIVCNLAKEYKIKYIRFSKEDYFVVSSILANFRPLINLSILKIFILNTFAIKDDVIMKKFNIHTTDCFYGILHTNHMTMNVIKNIIRHAKYNSFKTIEIGIHPAFPKDKRDTKYTSKQMRIYANQNNRLLEAKVLLSKDIRKYLLNEKIDLITYKDLNF